MMEMVETDADRCSLGDMDLGVSLGLLCCGVALWKDSGLD